MGTVRYTTVNGEVIAQTRNGARRQFLPDPLGSTVAMLDNTQTVTDTFSYWPYGEVASRTGTTQTPFQYVGTLGYYQDTGMHNCVRARHLDLTSGRWMTEDPLGFSWGERNLYEYARSQPTTMTDSRGLIPGIGEGQCPGQDALNLALQILQSNPTCLAAWKKICPRGMAGTLKGLPISSSQNCSGNPACTSSSGTRQSDGTIQCHVTDVCFSKATCADSVQRRAQLLLWELGNVCKCVDHHEMDNRENYSQQLKSACHLDQVGPGIVVSQ